MLGLFPKSVTGNRWIIVCVDYLTRYVETTYLSSARASEVAHVFLHFIILLHGAPRVVTSDRGRQFTADVVEELLRLCGSRYRHSTPYHQQTNGPTDQTNRTLTNRLAMYVSSDHENWDDLLLFITYAYNTAKHEVTGCTPFFYTCDCQAASSTLSCPFLTMEMLLYRRLSVVLKRRADLPDYGH